MEIPIQHDVYIWANYSVSSYLNFIPICWNVLIWLKYDFYASSFLVLWDHCADTGSWIRIFDGQYNSNNTAPSIGTIAGWG